ncbi:MAG: putative zinc-binding protein [Thermoplasmatota archaeon]
MKKIGILPCSGACNVGMLSTKTVVQTLDERENTDFVCALGLPLGIEGIIHQGKSSDGYIALNGCPVKCASKALKSADIPVDKEIVITERYGIKKNKNLNSEEKLEDIIAEVKRMVDEMQKDS